MIIPKTREQIELMRESALIVSKTLGMIAREIKPGITTQYLDKLAEEFIRDHGAEPGFLGLYDCPCTLLASVNEAIVHGLPTNRPLEEGDIVSADCGAFKNGFYGDHAYTFEVGEVAPEVKKLLQITKESLYTGIREFKAGNRVEDVGNAIQKYTEAAGGGGGRGMRVVNREEDLIEAAKQTREEAGVNGPAHAEVVFGGGLGLDAQQRGKGGGEQGG